MKTLDVADLERDRMDSWPPPTGLRVMLKSLLIPLVGDEIRNLESFCPAIFGDVVMMASGATSKGFWLDFLKWKGFIGLDFLTSTSSAASSSGSEILNYEDMVGLGEGFVELRKEISSEVSFD